MIVVADSSPLIALIQIGHVDLLRDLFQTVTIPARVAGELASAMRPATVQSFIAQPPAWLSVRTPANVEQIADLHAGEREAISLARELHADLLVIDDTDGRKAAVQRSLQVIGTVGVLERAAAQKLIDLKTAFDLLKQTDFWISHSLLDARLKHFLQRQES